MFKFFLLSLLFCPSLCLEARPLSLAECLREAMEHSPELQNARLDARLAELAVTSSAASFYPQLSLSGSEILAGDSLSGERIEAPLLWSPDTYSANASARWNLFRSTRDWHRLKSRLAEKQEAIENLRRQKDDVALRIVRGYFELLKQQRLVEVARRTLLQKQDRLTQATTLYENGSTPYADTLNQLTQVNGANRNLSLQETQAQKVLAELNVLLNRAPASPLELQDSMGDTRAAPDEQGSRELALKQRPELQALRASQEAARHARAQATLARLPLFSLDASFSKDLARYGRDATLWTHRGRGDENATWQLLASVTIPIFEGFGLWAADESARLLLEKEILALEGRERQVVLEVYLACLNLSQNLRTMLLDVELVEAARRNFAEVQKSYRNGSVSLYAVNEADTAYLRATIDQLNTAYDYQVNLALWKRAVGESLDK